MNSTIEQQINKLKADYNSTVAKLVKTVNDKIFTILKSRFISPANKNNQINTIKQNLQKLLASLKQKLNTDIENIKKQNSIVLPNNNINLIVTPILPSKKALLIGINYTGTEYQLSGCINDMININSKLTSQFGFIQNNIQLLTDETSIKPTKIDILTYFKNLLINSASGDQLFFAFSGHGSNILDRNGDEQDGYDEMIVSKDLQGITDDDLKILIQQYLKKDVSLFALFDSCHSGTILDLRYQYLDSNNYDNSTINTKTSETNGNIIMISGCMDKQTSADAYISNKYQGAMTWSFIETINTKPNLSWKELVCNMRNLLKTSQYEQIPQLCSGKTIDITSKFAL
jgi:hypothetical protein